MTLDLLSIDYDPALIFLSAAVSVIAAFVSLDVAERVWVTTGLRRSVWVGAAALALGGGIWSMHFIAMLAASFAIPVTYDVSTTLWSLGIAVGVTALAFVIMLNGRSLSRVAVAGAVMGMGIAAMHYAGMSAMQLAATLTYEPVLFTVSIVTAAAAATAALWVASRGGGIWRQATAAFAMGGAVCAMHYIGMAATCFATLPNDGSSQISGLGREALGQTIAAATVLILAIEFLAAIYDRRITILSQQTVETISKKRQAEEALAQKTNILDAMIGTLPDGVEVLDVSGRLAIWNSRLFDVLELDADRILASEQPERALHRELREKLGGCGDVDPRQIDDWRRRFSSGRWVECRNMPMPDGRLLRLYRDVTAEERDASALRESERRLQRNQEHLDLAQHLTGIGSVEHDPVKRTTEWSRQVFRILGLPTWTRPSFEKFLTLVDERDRPRIVATFEAAFRGEASAPSEFRLIRPDGELRIIYRSIEIVMENGHLTRVFITIRDVTEQRAAEKQREELEKQLLHSQKLEALGTLAGGIAHDLNNSLIPVITLTKLMLRTANEGSKDQQRLRMIFAAGERARDLVSQVQTFSRKDAPEKEPVDLREVVGENLKLLRATIPSSIAMDTHLQPVPITEADADKIGQVLVNVVSNAAQAIGTSGKITVELAPRGALEGGCGEIRLSVADTGCGMDEDTRNRVFEPFFTTKAVGKGTGLGLSVVHGIVESHGGRIFVTSEPGKGSRFDIYFPVTLPSAKAEQGCAA